MVHRSWLWPLPWRFTAHSVFAVAAIQTSPAVTRPSFDQAHATFERFLRTPFQSSSLPGVSEHYAPELQIDRTMSMERTQSSPGAHLGDYKPIYHEEARSQSGSEACVGPPPIQRSMSVAQGKFPNQFWAVWWHLYAAMMHIPKWL